MTSFRALPCLVQYLWLPICLLSFTRFGLADPLGGAVVEPAPVETTIGTTQEVPAPDAVAPNAAAILLRYQTALDQILLGHLLEARVLLEDSIRRYGDEPNLNLLLGYLLQREGRDEEARQRLAAVAKASNVAATYAAQVKSAPQTVAIKAETTTTPARLPQPDARLAKLEQAMARLVNEERTKLGLSTLIYDNTLSDVARAHSAEMRDRNYFAHESPTTGLRAPLDRYRAVFRAAPAMVAENIFRAWGNRHQLGEADVQKAHASLMQSPGHRNNIVQPRATRIGIGILANANGDIWITQMFSRPQ